MAWTRPHRLAVLAFTTLVTGAILSIALEWTIARILFVAPLLWFMPGYALMAILFPWRANVGRMDGFERIVYGLGVSIALSVILGVILQVLGVPINLLAVGAAFLVMDACLLVGALKRNPRPLRGNVGLRADVAELRPRLRAGWMAYLATGIGGLLFLVATAMTIQVGQLPHEKFSEFYVLGPGEQADCYPVQFARGRYLVERPGDLARCDFLTVDDVIVGVANHERRSMDYRIETYWHELDRNGSYTPIDSWSVHLPDARVGSFDFSKPHASQYEIRYPLPDPPGFGETRIVFRLFREGPAPDVDPLYELIIPIRVLTDAEFAELRDAAREQR